MINEAQIKAHLIQTDDDFRGLAERHKAYDAKLTELEQKSHLSDDEQIEEVRLKKLKLQAKDQMRDLVARYQATHH
ncbi:MAG: YdcH family protein [Bryobacteraceae bacterium]